ncbi:hypothetical protein DYI21_07645 [Thalassospira tepidiphila]|jgi:hypothetical protein|uniref:hypothetical protein n=1 Tax=Thalassospira tepidiphila TaxID=393657 RepID=UPI001BCF1ADD|nr:hypothetical protein [Thalassospira tepidiphila]MBS8273456.1 hypothetical protein [Thalassospira tepidiphila]
MTEVLLGLVLLFVVFSSVRIFAIWGNRHQGCDAYNILLNAEQLRNSRKLPIILQDDIFVLERPEQWYPPGFLVVCAAIPKKILEKYYWALNHFIDFGSSLLIYGVSYYTSSDYAVSLIFASLYSFLPGLVSEFSALNVRPLGLLFFNILMVLAYFTSLNIWIVPLLLLFSAFIFFTHKLSVQQLWLTLPIVAIFCFDPFFVAVLISIYTVPFLIWPYGARRILLGHRNIVKFWGRNWSKLGAHIVRESRVYANGQESISFYDKKNEVSAVSFFKNAVHQNYFVFPFMLIASQAYHDNPYFYAFLLGWVASVYILASMVHFVRSLRCIGLGRQYFKFALFPTLLGCAFGISRDASALSIALTLIASFLTLRQYFLIVRGSRGNEKNVSGILADDGLKEILNFIAADTGACVMCFPVHLCDLVAYKTRQKVYWGTHSDVFDERLENFFPVLKHELCYYVKDGVNRLLVDSRYVTPEELKMNGERLMQKSGAYFLYDVSKLTSLELR